MVTKINRSLWVLVLLATGLLGAKKADAQSGSLTLELHHFVGLHALVLDTVTYYNALGQEYTVTNFKYYISDIKLTSATGQLFEDNNYYLVDEQEQDSKSILLQKIPEGAYTAISFTLGVDSEHNCSGAQSGALDPVHGMFWTWNTGYIFLKLEGKAPAAATPGHEYEYHIGGYKAPANCIRTITIKLLQPVAIQSKQRSQLQLAVNVSEILKIPASVDFAKLPSVTDFHNAEMMADNYADMFSIMR